MARSVSASCIASRSGSSSRSASISSRARPSVVRLRSSACSATAWSSASCSASSRFCSVAMARSRSSRWRSAARSASASRSRCSATSSRSSSARLGLDHREPRARASPPAGRRAPRAGRARRRRLSRCARELAHDLALRRARAPRSAARPRAPRAASPAATSQPLLGLRAGSARPAAARTIWISPARAPASRRSAPCGCIRRRRRARDPGDDQRREAGVDRVRDPRHQQHRAEPAILLLGHRLGAEQGPRIAAPAGCRPPSMLRPAGRRTR